MLRELGPDGASGIILLLAGSGKGQFTLAFILKLLNLADFRSRPGISSPKDQ